MAISKKPPRGMRDFFPGEEEKRQWLFGVMRHVAALYGYRPYDGPLLEETALYRAKSGNELVEKQIYHLVDRGGRDMSIRPEMTPTLARMVAQIHRETPKPIRLYSIPNLLRYERPQRGRLREHWQFNCDVFAIDPQEGFLEIISLLHDLFKHLGASGEHYEILFNHRAFIEELYSTLKLDSETSGELNKLIDQSEKIPPEVFNERCEKFLTSEQQIIFREYLQLKDRETLLSFCQNYTLQNSHDYFKSLFHLLEERQLNHALKFSPYIMRGLDYYTGTVFEVFDLHPENRRALCGGGVYADLLKIFGEPSVTGIGFGLGDVTLLDFLETHQLFPAHYKNAPLFTLAGEENLSETSLLAQKLRAENFCCLTLGASVKFNKALKYARSQKSDFLFYYENQQWKIISLEKKLPDHVFKNHEEITTYLKREGLHE